jgi:hypothetical protein
MVALVLGAAVTGLVFRPGSAFAGVTVCDTDPVVTLSNGQTITLWDAVSADPSSIQGASYTLHIPQGLRVVSVSYDQYGALESFNWTADQNGNRFEDDTVVTTNPAVGAVPVSAWASLPQGNNTWSSSGTNGQVLTIAWKG